MTEPKYRIVFRGEIAPGQTEEQVRANLQRACQLGPAAADALFCGTAVVLKTDLDRAAAERLCASLAEDGASCAVEPMPPPPATRTAGKEQLAWLARELPQLVAAGVVDAATAARIGDYYRPAATEPRKTPLALVICAILGALLIGLGLILIIAHNWADLGRPARTALSFAPLVLAQLLAGLALIRHRDSTAWQEGAATFLLAAVGAAIALIGQTYHISGDLPRFLLVWMLLGLPLVYLLRSAMTTGLYWVGITAWMGYARFDDQPVSLYWLLLLLPAPFLWRLWHQVDRATARAWLTWVLALCLPLAVGFAQVRFNNAQFIGSFALLFGLYYLADRVGWDPDRSLRQRPLLLLGGLGLTLLGLTLSFRELWREIGRQLPLASLVRLLGFNLTTALLLGNLALLGLLLLQRKDRGGLLFGLSGLFLFGFQQLGGHLPGAGPVIVWNLYLLLLGAGTLVGGLRAGLSSRVNGGLGIIALLIIARFFDTDLPFTVKGIAFIAVGGGFLLANILIKRREVRP